MLSSSQRKLPALPSVQTPPSPAISSSYYSPPSTTFPGHELPIPFSSIHLNTTTPLTNISLLQTQESFEGPGQYHPIKDNIFMFGSEASCSSSDGSGSQISFGRDIKQEEIGHFQSYFPTGFEENHKLMMGYGGNSGGHDHWPEKPNLCFGESPFDQYHHLDQEDMKQQLISGSHGCTSSFLIDENKTQEKGMYYYYWNWNWLKVKSERFERVWWEEIQIRLQFLGLCVCWNETLLFFDSTWFRFLFCAFLFGMWLCMCPYSSALWTAQPPITQ